MDAADGARGTISGVPVSGSGTIRAATPKTSWMKSLVTTADGGPWATIRPCFIATRFVA